MILWVGMLIISVVLSSCVQQQRTVPKLKSEELQKVEALNEFDEFTGFKVADGKFYFTAYPEGNLNLYSLDLENQVVELIFRNIERYQSFIPLDGKRAVFVDEDSNLYYHEEALEYRIDEDISGLNSPNVLASPNGTGILYTKGSVENASLYRFMFDDKNPIKIIDKVEEEAFNTFHFTTQWSNLKDYFIYFNESVFDDQASLIIKINGTTSKWSPRDEYIAFVAMPKDKSISEITIGDWHTFIGKELALLRVADKEQQTIFQAEEGFIDPIESIQWSQDGNHVAISSGKIIKNEGYFEKIDYNKILIFDVKNNKKKILEPMNYNYYEFLFEEYLYGNNLGVKEALELVNFEKMERRKYHEPILLNSNDMFVINDNKRAFLVNDQRLIEIQKDGTEREILTFPWEVLSLYLDNQTQTMVVLNRQGEIYLLKI